MTRKAVALRHLRRVDPHFFRATAAHHASLPEGLVPKRYRAQLFESLISIVVSQQLGTTAADSIFKRVKEACGTLSPESVRKVPVDKLRAAGLSGSKVKTIKAIADAVRKNDLDLLSLKNQKEEDAAEQLMRIWGLGPWSAEMFLMFALGRSDVFSAGDLGLIRSMEMIYRLPKDTPREKLLSISEKWAPHRTYASLLLWRFRDNKK